MRALVQTTNPRVFVFVVALLALLVAPAAAAQNTVTRQTTLLSLIAEGRGDERHPVWVWIAGLVNGANAMAIIMHEVPVICFTHDLSEIEETENVIMRWVIANHQLGDPDALFAELAVPLAFMDAYPCPETTAPI